MKAVVGIVVGVGVGVDMHTGWDTYIDSLHQFLAL